MAYDIYIKGLHVPIPPEKIQINIPSTNEKYTLASNQEYVVPKKGGLREIEFELLIPNEQYPFAEYFDTVEGDYIENGNEFKNAKYYINYIEVLKFNKMVFQLMINRRFEKGGDIYNDNITVVLEDYTILESAENGYDVILGLKFREYVPIETKNLDSTSDGLQKNKDRESSNAPKLPANYTVVKGDSLWKLAKKYYNDGSKYTVIFNANKGVIKDPNKIYVGQVIKIPKLS